MVTAAAKRELWIPKRFPAKGTALLLSGPKQDKTIKPRKIPVDFFNVSDFIF
jgi:hypothetical protein